MHKKIRCLVLDDNVHALQILGDYIGKLPNLDLLDLCQDPFKALNRLHQVSVDLLFLDIEMPQINGIELLKSLPQKPMVIFTTGNPNYALEGYRLDAVDYLLKPFGFERFLQAVNKANRRRGRLHQVETAFQAPSMEEANPSESQAPKDYLLVKSEHKLHRIRYHQILYIEGMKEYVAFYLTSGRIFSLMSLKSLERALPRDRFIRTHRSYIVSVDKVNTLEGNQVHISQKKIPIGLSYKEQVLGQLFR